MEEKESAELIQKEQINALRSGSKSAILATLKALRTSGKVFMLTELFNLLADQDDQDILATATSLLNDLKDQESVSLLTEAISNPEYEEIQSILVAACWQNGLTYGKYIDIFIDVAIQGGYSSAIEAFTVIEGAIGEVEQERRSDLITSVKHGLEGADDHKKALLRELLHVIERY